MLDPTGKGERPREIGDDWNDLDLREALLKLLGALLEIVAGNVDGDVGGIASRRIGVLVCDPAPNSTTTAPFGTRAATSGMMVWKIPTSVRVG